MRGYSIGRFVLDLDRRQVLSGDRPIGLTPKNFDLLWELAKADGRLVSRDELAKLVWPDTEIEEATLRQNIYTLRTLLREADPEREYLENVPKVGYRLMVPVDRLDKVDNLSEVSPPAPPARTTWRRWWGLAAFVAMFVVVVVTLTASWDSMRAPRSARRDPAELIRQGWLILDSRDGERFPAALTLFDDALRIDSSASAAHAGKAVLFMLESKEKEAEAEAARAEQLDPGTAASYAVRGFMKMMYHWDWAGAGPLLEESQRRACPDSFCQQWYGWYLGFTGELSRAVRETSGAVERNPGRLAVRATYGQMLYWAGENDAAIRELRIVTDSAGGATHARLHLWKAQLAAGDRKSASQTLLLAVDPAWYRLPAEDDFRRLVARPDLLGTDEFFSRLFSSGKRNGMNSYYLAEIAMAAGNGEEALAELERAAAAHLFFTPYAKRDPLFAPLRESPRFQAVMQKVGL
jgi:DNA-binding winged helix-turn-helix (wHTH) protein